MTKIAKCYAKIFTFKKNLRFKQNVRFKSVRFDSKKVCATEVTHTEKCRTSFATTQNHFTTYTRVREIEVCTFAKTVCATSDISILQFCVVKLFYHSQFKM